MPSLSRRMPGIENAISVVVFDRDGHEDINFGQVQQRSADPTQHSRRENAMCATHPESSEELNDVLRNIKNEMMEIMKGELRNYVEEAMERKLQSWFDQQGIQEKPADQPQAADADPLFLGDHSQHHDELQKRDMDNMYRDIAARLEPVERLFYEDPLPDSVSPISTRTGQSLRGNRGAMGRSGTYGTSTATLNSSVAKMYHETGAPRRQVCETKTKSLSEASLPILDVAADESAAQDEIYVFSESAWDIMPFCGLGVLPCLDVIGVLVVMILNLAVQGCFIGLVWTTMLDSGFADDKIVTTLEQWRVLYAHNPDYADTFTDKPLVMDICERSLLRMQGASQASLYNNMDDYTKPLLAIPGGAMMCSLAVFLWMLTCAREVKVMFLFFRGIWTPNEASTKSLWRTRYNFSFIQIHDKPKTWEYGEARQKNYQLFVTPQRALTLTITVFLPRAIILALLACVGCLFLVRTLQPTDLILNAVALDVILNVDELLFASFAPAAARRMVYKTMPLRVRRTTGMCRRAEPWYKMALAMIICVAVVLGLVRPMVKTMQDAKSVMCDGDRAFLAVQLPYGPVVTAKTSGGTIDRGSHLYHAIYQRTKLSSAANARNPSYVEGFSFILPSQHQVQEIKKWRDRTISEVAVLPLGDPHRISCARNPLKLFHPSARVAMMRGVGSMIGNGNMQDCSNIEHLCFNDTKLAGQIVRLVCPMQCGNSKLSSRTGLVFRSPAYGTPASCLNNFVSALKRTPCQDLPLPLLLNDSGWRHFADGMVAHFTPRFREASQVNGQVNETHFNLMRSIMWQGMSTQGCTFFKKRIEFRNIVGRVKTVSFCDPRPLKGRQSVRPFCPITCGCKVAVKRHYQHMFQSSIETVLGESQCPLPCFLG